MADFKASIVIEHPDGEKSYTLHASSMRGLKHKIYMITFDDVAGENARASNQWRSDNYLRPLNQKPRTKDKR